MQLGRKAELLNARHGVFYLDSETLRILREAATQRGLSMSRLVRDLVHEHLAQKTQDDQEKPDEQT